MNIQQEQNTAMRYPLIAVFVFLILSGGCWRHSRQVQSRITLMYTDDCKSTTDLIVDGTYQGKNLYCQNPQVNCTDSTTRFVTVSVTINDTITIPTDSLASSAFEIPLINYGFRINDPVHIVITHYVTGKPKILNPEVH